MRYIEYYYNKYNYLFRWICKLRRKHSEENEFGGGADCIGCKVCDAKKVLRYYTYDEKNPYEEVENPKWFYSKMI